MRELVVRVRYGWCVRWIYALIVLVACGCDITGGAGKHNNHEAAASPAVPITNTAGGDVSVPASPLCTPKCGATCGADDGCGAKCGCKDGTTCKSGVCLDTACGPCRPNERCAKGACECVPNCDGRDCQDDGCGGVCSCPPQTGVNAQGHSVPLEQCHDSCKESNWECGSLCAVNCGACGAGQACKAGRCVCEPKCDGSSCSDGCGGVCDCASGTVCNAKSACVAPSTCGDTCQSTGLTCGSVCGRTCGSCADGQACLSGQCREAVSCSDCVLQLRLLDRTVIDDKIVRVKLGIDATFPDATSGPRLIDLRLAANKVVRLVQADAGPALLQTGKDLFVDETTREPWQVLGDQSYQLLAYNVSGTLQVASGQLLTATFDLAEPGPVKFSIARHNQTFAPLAVDNVLQSSAYDAAITVTP